MPVLLSLIAVRIVMSPLFLMMEYNRPGFPADPYGFTSTERLEYGRYAVDYLLNGEEIDFLGNLKLADGTAMYEATELRHMRDVKLVTQVAFGLAIVGAVLYGFCAIQLYRNNRLKFWSALRQGTLLTVILIVTIVVFAVTAWDFFFVAFHELFFQDGTWYFPYSDTLIRLFPEQFWFDAAAVIGFMVLSACGLLYWVSTRMINVAFKQR